MTDLDRAEIKSIRNNSRMILRNATSEQLTASLTQQRHVMTTRPDGLAGLLAIVNAGMIRAEQARREAEADAWEAERSDDYDAAQSRANRSEDAKLRRAIAAEVAMAAVDVEDFKAVYAADLEMHAACEDLGYVPSMVDFL